MDMETNALESAAASGPKKRGSKPAPAGSVARKPRDSLNRSVIIEAGLAVVKREGLSGLTFQALGDELGAHATSVYRHFRDKDELLIGDLDLGMIQEVRNVWQFYRDRRPESYGPITSP